MFLCQYDGKLHNDEIKSMKVVLKQQNLQNISKDVEIEVCYNCYGIINSKHFAELNNTFIVHPKDKVKIFKITSSNFENKDVKIEDKNLEDKKLVSSILSVMKKNIKKNNDKSNDKSK
jgi:hypothetical protein